MEILNAILNSSAFVYILLFAIVMMVCLLFACIFMFILRHIFRRIRFFVCIIIAVILVGVGTGYVALHPLISEGSSEINVQAINQAVSTFKGFYGWKMPLVAWRFEEYSPYEVEVNPLDTEGQQPAQNDIFVKVQYLPVGEIVLKYDSEHGGFTLERGLNQNETHEAVAHLFSNVSQGVLDSLPVAKPASADN